MIVCIIPARGGSKSIPHKNVVPLCGRPLLAWSIEQAHNCRAVDKVIVSTDDSEIGRVAAEWGASVFWRSAATATDSATSESALQEVVINGLSDAEAIVFLQATSPLRQPGDIDACVELVTQGDADSVFSCRIVEGYTWRFHTRDVREHGITRPKAICSPQYSDRLPRQYRSVTTLEENGSIYVFTPSVLLAGNRLGGRVLPYVMHPLDSFQIDEPGDIPLIEQLMELRLGCERTAPSR